MVLFVLTYFIEFIRDMFSKRLAAHEVVLSRLSCPCTLRAKRLAAYVVVLARLPCLLYMRSGWPLRLPRPRTLHAKRLAAHVVLLARLSAVPSQDSTGGAEQLTF